MAIPRDRGRGSVPERIRLQILATVGLPLAPQGRDFRIAQHDLLKGLASRSTRRGASSGG